MHKSTLMKFYKKKAPPSQDAQNEPSLDKPSQPSQSSQPQNMPSQPLIIIYQTAPTIPTVETTSMEVHKVSYFQATIKKDPESAKPRCKEKFKDIFMFSFICKGTMLSKLYKNIHRKNNHTVARSV